MPARHQSLPAKAPATRRQPENATHNADVQGQRALVPTAIQSVAFAPSTLPQSDVVQLQRTIGNRAVTRMLTQYDRSLSEAHLQNSKTIQRLEGDELKLFLEKTEELVKARKLSGQRKQHIMRLAKHIGAMYDKSEEAEKEMHSAFKRAEEEQRVEDKDFLNRDQKDITEYVLDQLRIIDLSIPEIAQKYVSPFKNEIGKFPAHLYEDVIQLVYQAVTTDIEAVVSDQLLLRLVDAEDKVVVCSDIVKRIDKYISVNLNFGKYFGNQVDNIPPMLHFIWSGRQISEDALQNVLAWAASAKGTSWTVFMWSDLEISNWTKKEDLLKRANIQLIDVYTVLDQRFKAAYEFARLHNLAGASDLVRLSILKKMGGVYSDVDIGPGKHNLNQSQLQASPLTLPLFAPLLRDADGVRSVLKKDKKEQLTQRDIEEAVKIQTGLGNINNNFIIAHPRCMFLDPVINHISNELSKPQYDASFWANSSGFIASITGPGVIMGMLQKMVAMREDISLKQADDFLKQNYVCQWLLQWLTAESEDKDWSLSKRH